MRYVFGHYLDCRRWWTRDSKNLTKTGQCSLKSFHGTIYRYSMTFTFSLKKSSNDLKYCRKRKNISLSVIFVGKFLLRLLSADNFALAFFSFIMIEIVPVTWKLRFRLFEKGSYTTLQS